jgi:hypothetical protein
MKSALSAIALATALTLAPFIGGSFAVADDSAQREDQDRFSPEDRAAFLDARIAALKAGLELNTRASERLAARAADMQKLAAAAKPLYDSLDDGQKRRFAVLFHGSMGRGQWRHGRRDG